MADQAYRLSQRLLDKLTYR